MNKTLRILLTLPLAALLMAACGSDGGYHYPSVRLEFVTATTDAGGVLAAAETDDGLYYNVSQDLTGKAATADSTLRIVANYEAVAVSAEASRTADMKIYAWMTAVSPLPLPAEKFDEGVRTDPVSVVSIWRGRGYLNLVLTVREQGGKHRLHFVEEELTASADGAVRHLKLRLYHSIDATVQDYDKRLYLSVPLRHYFTEGVQQLEVRFEVNTYNEGVKCYDFTFE